MDGLRGLSLDWFGFGKETNFAGMPTANINLFCRGLVTLFLLFYDGGTRGHLLYLFFIEPHGVS